MRRNSLILQKKFSTRWRHLYISKSQGIEVTRLALGGITAAAPRSSRSARIPSLSKALSASRAAKSRSVRSGATPALSCPATEQTARERIDQRDDRQATARAPDGLRPSSCAATVLVHPDDGAIDDDVFEVGIRRQGSEKLIEHAASDPPTESLKHRIPIPEILGKVAPQPEQSREPLRQKGGCQPLSAPDLQPFPEQAGRSAPTDHRATPSDPRPPSFRWS